MDTVEIIGVSLVGAIVGVIMVVGISVICLRYRADKAAADVVAAADVESPGQNTTMPHPPSVNDLTYIRCA
jgi:hypothetical protein